jgi:TolB-like protein/class 3 adenylate cyclase
VSEEVRERVQRRLAAILVAGYSRLTPGEEVDRFAELRAVLSGILKPRIAEFEGNIFKETAETVLADFDGSEKAARCAAALRDEVVRRNQQLPEEERIALRIGINFGDIIVEEGDIFGDGVNIAARVEALAKPGSVYVSEIVYDQIADEAVFDFEDLGPQELKNIARPIRIYRLTDDLAELSEELVAAAATVSASAPVFDNRHAIAVLPFTNFSGDPEQEFFADGITEDVISLLAGWRAFPVIARASTFVYKGQIVDIKKVGEELGVRYVLEGSVRKSGRRVRVTAQLIRADNNHHIMAERYDRNLSDLFELQDEIVTTIAGAIEPELLKFERERIVERAETNADAYQFYQRGMWHHYRHSKADNIEAQTYFRRALEIDPQYPQATAALSIAVLNPAYLGWTDDIERNYAEAYDLALRAVDLDARYPNAHFALGVTCMYTHRSNRAMVEMRQAIELNPSFAAAQAILGHMLTYAGQPEETIALVEKALRLSPNDPRLFIWLPALAAAHYQLRHYEQAVEIGRRSWTLNRNWPVGLRYVVAGLAQLGRLDEACAALADLKKLDADLAAFERVARRVFQDEAPVEHILDGLRKAGFE